MADAGQNEREPLAVGLPVGLEEVLESAARLQELVPDAVLVGGSAAALDVHHRMSTDHDHVVTDIRDRFDMVLDALERDGEFVLNRAVHGKIILGEFGGKRRAHLRRSLSTGSAARSAALGCRRASSRRSWARPARA